MTNYLPLTEYSTKYKVSLSTLRRRIKSEDIQFLFEEGRYLVLDEPMGSHQRHRPSQINSDKSLMSAPFEYQNLAAQPSQPAAQIKNENITANEKQQNVGVESSMVRQPQEQLVPVDFAKSSGEEPILTAANRLLTELKRAYTQILQEKEEQILQLKDEVADLKTLVRVLESENERNKKGFFS